MGSADSKGNKGATTMLGSPILTHTQKSRGSHARGARKAGARRFALPGYLADHAGASSDPSPAAGSVLNCKPFTGCFHGEVFFGGGREGSTHKTSTEQTVAYFHSVLTAHDMGTG